MSDSLTQTRQQLLISLQTLTDQIKYVNGAADTTLLTSIPDRSVQVCQSANTNPASLFRTKDTLHFNSKKVLFISFNLEFVSYNETFKNFTLNSFWFIVSNSFTAAIQSRQKI